MTICIVIAKFLLMKAMFWPPLSIQNMLMGSKQSGNPFIKKIIRKIYIIIDYLKGYVI